MPIEPPRSPILDLMYASPAQDNQPRTLSQEDLADLQKEQENRLIGSMGFQAVFLALAIMLYESWEWSQFDEVWQSALLYGMFAFCFQAAIYMLYRTIFEDSTNHRRNIRRLKNKNKKRMSHLKYEMDKHRTEFLLEQQMAQFQSSMALAQSDHNISPDEAAMLNQQIGQIKQTAQQANPNISLEELAQQLGLDRHRVGPIPIGPKLTISQPPLESFQPRYPVQQGLDPTQQN